MARVAAHCLPVDEDVAAAEARAVDEVVAQREVLLEVLIGGVRRHDTQVMFVLRSM